MYLLSRLVLCRSNRVGRVGTRTCVTRVTTFGVHFIQLDGRTARHGTALKRMSRWHIHLARFLTRVGPWVAAARASDLTAAELRLQFHAKSVLCDWCYRRHVPNFPIRRFLPINFVSDKANASRPSLYIIAFILHSHPAVGSRLLFVCMCGCFTSTSSAMLLYLYSVVYRLRLLLFVTIS